MSLFDRASAAIVLADAVLALDDSSNLFDVATFRAAGIDDDDGRLKIFQVALEKYREKVESDDET